MYNKIGKTTAAQTKFMSMSCQQTVWEI